MAKLAEKTVNFVLWLVGIVAALALGGFFISGGFMETFLGILPLVIHKIVGWVIIISTGIGAILKLVK